MRWIPLEVFTAGEPNSYPPGVAVLRRLHAVPQDPSPGRTWLLPSINGSRVWHRFHDRHTGAVVGHAWVRHSALRWRRAAWSGWVLALLATFSAVVVLGPDHEGVVEGFGAMLIVLLAAALVLRVRAVIDPDDGEVGIRS